MANKPTGTPERPPTEDVLFRSSSSTPEASPGPATVLGGGHGDRLPDAEVLFPLTTHLGPVFQNREQDETVVLGLSAVERGQRHEAFTALMRATGFGPDLARRLYDAGIDADMGDDRDTPPPDRAIFNERHEDTAARLRGRYGDRLDDLLARTHAFTKQHPELHTLLGRRGIGSRPEIVLAIVEHVRRHEL